MRFSPRNDREILSRMQKQRKYPSKQKTWKANAAIQRTLESMHKGANMSTDFGFGSVEDLLDPIEDSYYVPKHFSQGADARTEMGGWVDSPRKKAVLALVIVGVIAWRAGWLKNILG